MVAFKSGDRLAATFGLAVSCTMFATSIAYYVLIDRILRWAAARAAPLLVAFIVVDGSFVAAGLRKFIDGAAGRRVIAAITAQSMPVADVLDTFGAPLHAGAPAMVFLSPGENRIPFIAEQRWFAIARMKSTSCFCAFVLMQRSARRLPDDLGIPTERRIELSVSVMFDAPRLSPLTNSGSG